MVAVIGNSWPVGFFQINSKVVCGKEDISLHPKNLLAMDSGKKDKAEIPTNCCGFIPKISSEFSLV